MSNHPSALKQALNGRLVLRILAVVAVAFGFLTLREGGAVLFGDEAARAAAGRFVAFVLWSNFMAGFAYVAAGVGLWFGQSWSWRLALAIFIVTALTFAAFVIHIASGAPYELRTIVAMSLRTLVWGFVTLVARRRLGTAKA